MSNDDERSLEVTDERRPASTERATGQLYLPGPGFQAASYSGPLPPPQMFTQYPDPVQAFMIEEAKLASAHERSIDQHRMKMEERELELQEAQLKDQRSAWEIQSRQDYSLQRLGVWGAIIIMLILAAALVAAIHLAQTHFAIGLTGAIAVVGGGILGGRGIIKEKMANIKNAQQLETSKPKQLEHKE